jgi:hypothetical protein
MCTFVPVEATFYLELYGIKYFKSFFSEVTELFEPNDHWIVFIPFLVYKVKMNG